MPYTPQVWNNDDAATPLSAPRLTHMENGIAAANDAVDLAATVASGVLMPTGWDTQWQTALATASSTRVNVAVIGDSVTRGYFASSLDTLGYVGKIRDALQATYGDGGSGFISAAADLGMIVAVPTGYAGQMKVTATGFAAAAPASGPGVAGPVASSTNGHALTFTSVRATTIELFYLTLVGGGTFTYAIDGGAAVPVSTNAANGTGKTTITGLSNTTHTVVITVTVAASGVFVSGPRGLKATGIVFDNYAMQGASTADLIGNPTWGDRSAWSGGSANQADLIICNLGLNDDAANVSAATYIANLQHLVDNAGTASLLFVLNLAGPTWSANDLNEDYSNAIYTFCASNGAALLDMRRRFGGSWDTADALDYWSTGAGTSGDPGTDQAHPGNTGHAILSRQAAPMLASLVPSAPA